MRAARPLAPLVLLLLAPAPVSADAGGDDAPDTRAAAALLAPGTYAGALPASDPGDMYAFRLGPKEALRLDVTTDIRYWGGVTVYDERDRVVFGRALSSWSRNVSATMGEGDQTLYVRVHHDSFWSPRAYNYTLTLAAVPAADLAVTGLDVVAVPVATDAGPLATGTLRDVTITFDNHGAARGLGTLELWAVTPTDGAARWVGSASLGLEPGESGATTFRWNAAGRLGDVRLVATLTSLDHDLDRQDNARETWSHAVVGGLGIGVTASP